MILLFLEWLVLAILSIVMTKIVFPILAPIVALFADESGWLPDWLNWFQTPDNSLDGDSGWRNKHWQWRYKLPSTLATYIGRVGWLWRNSGYGFEISVLGRQIPLVFTYEYIGNQHVSDRPLSEGAVLRKVYSLGGDIELFQYYAIIPWSSKYCLRVMAGWKIWQHPEAGRKVQIAINFNPFKSFEVK